MQHPCSTLLFKYVPMFGNVLLSPYRPGMGPMVQ